MRQLTIALDMDSTVYDLHTPWLAWLKDTHGINLAVEDITSWNLHEWLPCGEKVYDYLHLDDAFTVCRPYEGAIEAINEVNSWGVRQFFVSTIVSKTGAWQKQKAVERDFPYLKKDVLITSGHKDLVQADILFDDGPHNLEAFKGRTCKVPYTYNKHVRSDFTMESWEQYTEIIKELLDEHNWYQNFLREAATNAY